MTEGTRLLEGVEAPAQGTWELDPAHTNAGFVARHLMVTKVRGRFTDASGRIRVGEGPEDSLVEVEIAAASIDSGDEDRDAHLRSPDFLDVERFPTIGFRSTRVERTGERTLRVEGDLTIRDVTRPVVLDAEYLGASRDWEGNPRIGFSATTRIDREDFGITWNVALEAGGWLVSKDVEIELEAQAILRQAGERAA